MTDTSSREIPGVVYSRMTLNTKNRLDQLRKRSLGQAEIVTKMKSSRSVSDFLEEKVKAFNCELEYIECAKAHLNEARDSGIVSAEEYVEALEPFLADSTQTARQKALILRQRKIIEDDLTEEVEANKRARRGEPSIEILERAYANTVVRKVMHATANQPKSKFNQSKFRKEVAKYYGVAEDTGYCHLTGYWESGVVKAAHLVPKSMKADELCDLFGVGELVLSDPRNALMLHRTIEEGLDAGTIVIIPISDLNRDQAEPSRWKCVLVRKDKRKDMCAFQTWKWEDLDGKELTFLNSNRPARRFLYFRFIITYIFMMKEGRDMSCVTAIHTKNLWATPGEYLRKSTLNTLARNISGFDLPPPLLENTFGDNQYEPKKNFSSFSSDITSQELRKAILVSSRASNSKPSSTKSTAPSSEDDAEYPDEDYEKPIWEDTVEFQVD